MQMQRTTIAKKNKMFRVVRLAYNNRNVTGRLESRARRLDRMRRQSAADARDVLTLDRSGELHVQDDDDDDIIFINDHSV